MKRRIKTTKGLTVGNWYVLREAGTILDQRVLLLAIETEDTPTVRSTCSKAMFVIQDNPSEKNITSICKYKVKSEKLGGLCLTNKRRSETFQYQLYRCQRKPLTQVQVKAILEYFKKLETIERREIAYMSCFQKLFAPSKSMLSKKINRIVFSNKYRN